jgi:N-carbamoylputrescine amidase
MTTPPDAYSYSPKELLASYERLKLKEEEFLERSSGDAPMLLDGGESGAMSTASSTASKSNKTTMTMVVAATQITGAGLPHSDVTGFCFRAEQAVEIAAKRGANLVLLPELWCGPYFCQSQVADLLLLADPVSSGGGGGGGCRGEEGKNNSNSTIDNILIRRMQQLARLYGVVLPVSIYERKNNALYNSVVMIDADGSVLGTYRKTHIPDGTGYQEKFYFTPGDTGFVVFDTRVGRVGVAICWDQWFPESARCLALQGADVILYPTAIGSEPQDPTINSADHWQRVMQGHAAANMVPVVASNRFGTEILAADGDEDGAERQRIHFYGRSFITDNKGAIVAECEDNSRNNDPVVVVTAEIDVERNLRERLAWGLFRDRRPDRYGFILSKDGRS